MALGYRLPPFDVGTTPGVSTTFPRDLTYPQGTFNLIDGRVPAAGAFDINQPVSELPRRFAGARLSSFFDDYYNNIYLVPPSINFGSVTADVEQTVHVWNAFTRTQMLTGITEQNTAGLKLFGPSLPVLFARMDVKPYRVLATTDGAAYIDARYNFKFQDVPPVSVLSVFGARAELWVLPPNWSERYNISYEYKTDIFKTRSGKEQRRALRNTARRTIEFQSLANGDRLRWFNRVMGGWQRNSFLMPERTRHANTVSPMPAGTAQVTLDAIPSWLKAGASIVLALGDQTAARLVQSVNGTVVTFTSIGPESWIPGAKVHPGLTGRLAPEISTRRLTSEVATVAVVFNETPAVEPYQAPPAPAVTWRNTEVVLLKPNYVSPISLRHQWTVENVDYDRGVTKTFVPVDVGSRTWQAQYLGADRQAVQQLVDVFHRAKGRRGSFYMPTWENDLPPLDAIGLGSFRIRTAGVDVARLLNGDAAHRNIAVFGIDGSVMFNHVQQIFTLKDSRGEDTILTLSNAWQRTMQLGEILRICWMPLWRFGSDRLTVSWVTDEVATITPTMQMLEDTP
jgi:hypothetical protein